MVLRMVHYSHFAKGFLAVQQYYTRMHLELYGMETIFGGLYTHVCARTNFTDI